MPLIRLIDPVPDATNPEDLYLHVSFPEPPPDRPYVFANMVATVDGRIVLGEIGDSAVGVGEATDQLLFRRLQKVCDAALLGASTLRASQVLYPPEKPRYTLTRTGEIPLANRFFRDAPDRAFVIAPEDLPEAKRSEIAAQTNLLQFGLGEVDLRKALGVMRCVQGVRYLLCEGGAHLNDALIREGLMDELFLTITPKLKGASHLPSILEGAGFPRGAYLPLSLVSLYADNNELYFRYRLGKEPRQAF